MIFNIKSEKGKIFTRTTIAISILILVIVFAGISLYNKASAISEEYVGDLQKETDVFEDAIAQIDAIINDVESNSNEDINNNEETNIDSIIKAMQETEKEEVVYKEENIESNKDNLSLGKTQEQKQEQKQEQNQMKNQEQKKKDEIGSTNGNDKTQTNVAQQNNDTIIGRIEIPKTNLNYPIHGIVSPEILEIAVAMQFGAGLNKVGNTVIMGHNYQNGKLFSNNPKLESGDSIYITDSEGDKVEYTVYDKQYVSETETSYYLRDTGGKREITLLCCADDEIGRMIILAREL